VVFPGFLVITAAAALLVPLVLAAASKSDWANSSRFLHASSGMSHPAISSISRWQSEKAGALVPSRAP